uniref:SET and MYND domain-containing protein 4 isoform X2 n=1 Tax=Rhizophora mucronata TaxID=61149 RepID=A0A2P2LMB9_RHIMU
MHICMRMHMELGLKIQSPCNAMILILKINPDRPMDTPAESRILACTMNQ